MLRTRVIPILLLRDRGLYKGIKFKNHKYVGDPINTVKIFNDKEVDELVLLDIDASKCGKPIDFELLQEISTEAFMPLAYGGGVSSMEDAKKLFSIGIEKIILNSIAILNPGLLKELIDHFGAQSIVISLDIKKSFFGKYHLYIKSGTVKTKYNPIDFAIEMKNIGVGEIIINSIDNDGKMKGYDLEFLDNISNKLSVPIVMCGGAGNLEDFKKAKDLGASAVGAGSMFVYNGVHKAVLITYPSYEKLCAIFGEN